MGQDDPQVDSKSVFTSKTYGANMLLVAATEFYPGLSVWIGTHPQTAVLVVAAMNLVLRHLSDTPLHFWKPKS